MITMETKKKHATVEAHNSMLDIGEPVPVDESIESFEYGEYEPQNPAAINNGQAIQIDIQAHDVYTNPSKSYILVEGQITSATEAAYTAASEISLINNSIPYMFSQIRYLLNNNEIDNVTTPGQATTMKGLLSYGDDFSKSEALNMCWQKDTTAAADSTNLGWEARRQMIIARPEPVGTFSFCVPLKHLFGFADDYHKVVYGVKHSLLLSRQSDSDAIYHDNSVPNGKITLTKIAWLMPHVTPSLKYKNDLQELIERKIKIPIAFRAMHSDSLAVPQTTSFSWPLGLKTGTETPRWLLIGFQTGRSGSQTANPAVFDHVQVRNIYVMLNTRRYPFIIDTNINFTQHKTSRAYKALLDFKESYYGIDGRESSCQVTPLDFVDFYPIHVLDVRAQSEALKSATQNITVKVEFDSNVPANTTAYAVLISDKLLYLEADGSKFNVVWD